MTQQKHYVTFFSPGTFVSEQDDREVDSWDVPTAVGMAAKIKQRHGATPYGFRFSTMESDGWEPKTVKRSNMYYLGGTIKTLNDIPDVPENRILRDNMISNSYTQVIENTNSWKVTMPLYADDVVLDFI